jgi:hypothetical protein
LATPGGQVSAAARTGQLFESGSTVKGFDLEGAEVALVDQVEQQLGPAGSAPRTTVVKIARGHEPHPAGTGEFDSLGGIGNDRHASGAVGLGFHPGPQGGEFRRRILRVAGGLGAGGLGARKHFVPGGRMKDGIVNGPGGGRRSRRARPREAAGVGSPSPERHPRSPWRSPVAGRGPKPLTREEYTRGGEPWNLVR